MGRNHDLLEACVNGLAEHSSMADMVRLLGEGAHIETRDQWGKTPLMCCCWAGNLAMVKYLLDKGAKVNVKSHNGNTPLHYASRARMEIVSELLERKAELNAQNKTGETPLIVASYYGKAESVRILLEHGADLSIESWDGQTYVFITRCWGYGVQFSQKRKRVVQNAAKWADHQKHTDIVRILHIGARDQAMDGRLKPKKKKWCCLLCCCCCGGPAQVSSS